MLTLVFTDLADSTALKGRHGDSAVDVLLVRHREHVERLAVECSGRIIDWAGDGCFLTFEISSAGVIFALRLQQVHAEEPDLPGVRVGIHQGEVTETPATGGGPPRVGGLTVDLASRICGLAKPGQLLMSSAVYNSARQRLGVDTFGQPVLWQTHGTYAIKGFDEPLDIGEAALEGLAPLEAPTSGDKAKLIRRAKHPAGHAKTRSSSASSPKRRRLGITVAGIAAALALLGVAYYAGQSKTKSGIQTGAPAAPDAVGPIKSLAVLPLGNFSKDPDQEYFADGMTEAITSELSKIKAIKVISRTSVMKYKNTEKTMPEIAAELKVDGLIEGSVQRDGDDVKITVKLIHGPSDTHVWTDFYTNTMTSVLMLQSEVALAIADALKVELTGVDRDRIARTRTVNPKAYDKYLLGIHFMDQVTGDGLRTSIRYFEEATRLDPNYAEAWARLSMSYRYLTTFGFGVPAEVFPKARAADTRALELDPDLPMVHEGLGRTLWTYDREWEQAESQFRRALELDPNYASGHNSYATYLVAMGRLGEAVAHAQTALELEADDPWVVRNAQFVFIYSGQPDRARAQLERTMEARPDFLPGILALTGTYGALGESEKAIAAGERWANLSNRSAGSLDLLALTLASSGQLERARAILDEASAKSEGPVAGRVLFVYALFAYALLGEMDTAFKWMETSVDSRDFGVFWFRVMPYRKDIANNPNMIRFRTDPRFHEIIDRMKYPPLPPEHPGYADEQAWLAKKKAAADANAPITKIAVLPFKNISGDPQQEYFVDGMTEALISELSKIKSIKVISRTSSMYYKDSDMKAQDIARELDVEGLIEGSAMKAGNEVRINATLVRGATQDNLWTQSYMESVENVLKVQAQVALAITTAIKAVVTPDERNRVNAAKMVNIEAYELYVQARHYWSLRSPDGIRRAGELFTKSLEIDPNFALGHVGLADTYSALSEYYLMPSAESLPLARQEAEKALALDPALGEAYATLAKIDMTENWDWKTAEAAFLKSIELSPNHPTAHQWYGGYLNSLGRHAEAADQLQQAYQLDPASPVIAAAYAQSFSYLGQNDESVKQHERIVGQFPDNSRVLLMAARAYLAVGRNEEALQAAERAVAADPDDVSAPFQMLVCLARLGRTDEARRLLEENLSHAGSSTVPAVWVSRVYIALDDRESAFEWLNKACDVHDPFVWRLKFFPEFDALESDPRYQALLRRMNFPE